MSIGYFDGATSKGLSGGGMFLKLNYEHPFLLWMGCGSGSNTKVELLALWGLLQFANYKGIGHLQVVGDSKVTVEQAAGNSRLHALRLEQRCSRIVELKHKFSHITFSHIYRQPKLVADRLSKKTMGPMDGQIHFEELKGNSIYFKGSPFCLR